MAAITTANGANATKRAALNANTTTLSDFMDGANQWGTKLRVCYDNYEMDGDTAAAGMVFTRGAVPNGARVVGGVGGDRGSAAAASSRFLRW